MSQPMERIGNVELRRIVPILGLLVSLGAAGCDDPFEDIDNLEGAATLYSLSRPEYVGYPSALSLVRQSRGAVVVEAATAGGWDVVLMEDDGEFVFVPGGAFEQQGRGAILMETERTFEEVTEAPEDGTLFNDTLAVPVRFDAVYLVRSRSVAGIISCNGYFSKMRVAEIDEEMGSVRVEYILNPNCSARGLQPPPDEEDG